MSTEIPIKLLSFVARREGVTESYFRHHYSQVHTRLVLGVEQIMRYGQFYPTGDALHPFPATSFDAVAEVWFSGVTSLASTRTGSYYPDVILVDEHRFLDHDNSRRMITTENVILAGPAASPDEVRLKGVILARRRTDVSPEAFRSYCATELPAIVRESVPDLIRAVVCTPLDPEWMPTSDEPDAVLELWWDRTFVRDRDTVPVDALATALSGSAVDVGASSSMVGMELPILPGNFVDWINIAL